MEKEIKEIKEKVQGFCERYNCAIEIETFHSRDTNGKIIRPQISVNIKL